MPEVSRWKRPASERLRALTEDAARLAVLREARLAKPLVEPREIKPVLGIKTQAKPVEREVVPPERFGLGRSSNEELWARQRQAELLAKLRRKKGSN